LATNVIFSFISGGMTHQSAVTVKTFSRALKTVLRCRLLTRAAL
jgi:hypothetical protein